MFWIDHSHRLSRRLTAFSATAAMVGASLLGVPPATPQDQTPDPQPATAPTASAPAPTSFTQSQVVPVIADPGSNPTPVVLPKLTPEQLGDTLMARQRYQAAIEAYKGGPRDSAQLWNKMGIAYQLLFNLDEATRCYERSLKLDSKSPTVLNNLGTVYDSQKQYPSAERMYRKAIKFDTKSALIYKNLGTNLLSQHKYKKGWEDYQLALAIDPDVFQHSTSPRVENPASVGDRGAMNYYMARGCVRAGMNERAIEYLRMALNEGFTSPKKIMADTEFAGLHGIPAFEQLLTAQGTP
jgi:tetratricopeptide (TPR) repeat protein